MKTGCFKIICKDANAVNRKDFDQPPAEFSDKPAVDLPEGHPWRKAKPLSRLVMGYSLFEGMITV